MINKRPAVLKKSYSDNCIGSVCGGVTLAPLGDLLWRSDLQVFRRAALQCINRLFLNREKYETKINK